MRDCRDKRVSSAIAIPLVLLAVCTVISIIVFGVEGSINTNSVTLTAALEDFRTREVIHTELSTNKESMVMGLDYWEQIGNAVKNLFDLQCWASSVGIRSVVEPSVNATLGKTVLKFLKDEKYLKFRDLFDITHWNLMSSNSNFSRLVSLEYFLKHGSKDVVFSSDHLYFVLLPM